MALSYRTQKKWQLVLTVTAISAVLGITYTGLRMVTGVVTPTLSEMENTVRTAATLGFFLGSFMFFCVYAERGAIFRRLGFVSGWILLELISSLIIVVSIVINRIITAVTRSEMETLYSYFTGEIFLDTTIALIGFLVISFFLQLRRLVGEGTMTKMLTGRYHNPRKERRVYMFLDIKNSTAMAEQLGDEKTHALITQVFFDADRLVSEFRGEVLSYNGDELVASWLENAGLEHGRCLECYGEIVKTLHNNSDDYEKRFGVRPEFWAGFHVGDVMVGECGDSRLSIVHIGDTPNTAARLEHYAKESGHDCLASEALVASTTLPKGISASPLGSVCLKGHTHDTQIYAIQPT
jgi:adenylate cyclase